MRFLKELSLSPHWNSSLKWAHCTFSHTGFSDGFERSYEFFQHSDRWKYGEFFCAHVYYSNNRPSIEFHPLAPIDA